MNSRLALLLCGVAIIGFGCAEGITRTGYKLPAGETTKDLPRRAIAIQYQARFSTNEVVILGSIHAYDTGISIDCDEATVLDIFCREGAMLGADLVNITEEHQPNPLTSTCYRARATFLRFKDREKAKTLVSDAKYSPEEIAKRVTAADKRNEDAMIGAAVGGAVGGVVGGALGGMIASAPKASSVSNAYSNKIPVRGSTKP